MGSVQRSRACCAKRDELGVAFDTPDELKQGCRRKTKSAKELERERNALTGLIRRIKS